MDIRKIILKEIDDFNWVKDWMKDDLVGKTLYDTRGLQFKTQINEPWWERRSLDNFLKLDVIKDLGDTLSVQLYYGDGSKQPTHNLNMYIQRDEFLEQYNNQLNESNDFDWLKIGPGLKVIYLIIIGILM